MKIRPFEAIDYDSLIALWEKAGLECKPNGRDSHKQIRLQTEKTNLVILLAEDGGDLIGSVIASHDGRKGWINRLAVDPERRNEGIARELVSNAEDWFEKEGIGIFACLIERGNTVSLKTFNALGYVEFPGMHYLTKRKHPDI